MGETTKAPVEPTEGWQAERRFDTRVYHYIVDTFALCRGLGFYFGELTPDVPNAPKGKGDCAKCFRVLRRQQAAVGKDGGA